VENRKGKNNLITAFLLGVSYEEDEEKM